jgi:AraC family transcriptional regulator, melibiose operon regulatory protein
MRSQFDPSRRDFTPYGFTAVEWTPTLMPKADHHDEVELNFMTEGSITYIIGGRREKVMTGRMFVFWAAIPHQVVEINTKVPYYVMTIPLSWFLQSGFPSNCVQALLNGIVFSDTMDDRFEIDVMMFRSWIKELDRNHPYMEEIVMLEAKARLARLFLSSPVLDTDPSVEVLLSNVETGGLSAIEKMACFVARHYDQPLKVEDICKASGLHPNYAMNLFKKGFGSTLNEYLTYHRLSHAQRLLVSSNDKIIDIAFQSGFGSLSQFNVVFKNRFGCSPRHYRYAHMTH